MFILQIALEVLLLPDTAVGLEMQVKSYSNECCTDWEVAVVMEKDGGWREGVGRKVTGEGPSEKVTFQLSLK